MPIPADFKTAISALSPSSFASQWIFERVPVVFNDNLNSYVDWKHKLAGLLDVDPRAISIVGTAATGTSLNPHKNFKQFDPESDIDVAIISNYHFSQLWHWLRNLGSAYHRLPQDAKYSIDEHKSKYVYWGTFATEKLLHHTPLAQTWIPALSSMAKIDPTIGRDINVRIYADFDALRAYQINGIASARKKAIEN